MFKRVSTPATMKVTAPEWLGGGYQHRVIRPTFRTKDKPIWQTKSGSVAGFFKAKPVTRCTVIRGEAAQQFAF